MSEHQHSPDPEVRQDEGHEREADATAAVPLAEGELTVEQETPRPTDLSAELTPEQVADCIQAISDGDVKKERAKLDPDSPKDTLDRIGRLANKALRVPGLAAALEPGLRVIEQVACELGGGLLQADAPELTKRHRAALEALDSFDEMLTLDSALEGSASVVNSMLNLFKSEKAQLERAMTKLAQYESTLPPDEAAETRRTLEVRNQEAEAHEAAFDPDKLARQVARSWLPSLERCHDSLLTRVLSVYRKPHAPQNQGQSKRDSNNDTKATDENRARALLEVAHALQLKFVQKEHPPTVASVARTLRTKRKQLKARIQRLSAKTG